MRSNRTSNLILCAMFVALIVAGAFIKIPIPMLPITLQTLFTSLAGLLLGKKWGCLSVCIYILLGLMGLPVFAHGGGVMYVFQPSFGYILGFAVGSFVTGWIAEKKKNPDFKWLLFAELSGLLLIYLPGVIYYYLVSELYLGITVEIRKMLLYCFVLTFPGDVLLCVLAAFLGMRLIGPIKMGKI